MEIKFTELKKVKRSQIERSNNISIRKGNRKTTCDYKSRKFKNIKDKKIY